MHLAALFLPSYWCLTLAPLLALPPGLVVSGATASCLSGWHRTNTAAQSNEHHPRESSPAGWMGRMPRGASFPRGVTQLTQNATLSCPRYRVRSSSESHRQ